VNAWPTSRAAGLACTLALLSLGCPGAPATHYYVLGPRSAPEALRETAGTGMLVGVRTFEVDAPYDQDRIVYRLGQEGFEIGFYDYHRWAVPLGRVLPGIVVSRLGVPPGRFTVEAEVPGRAYDAWLTGRLIHMEEVDHAGGQDVRVTLELGLELADGSRVWSATAERSTTLDTREVAAVVAAMHDVVAEAVDDLRPRLEIALGVLGTQRGAPSR